MMILVSNLVGCFPCQRENAELHNRCAYRSQTKDMRSEVERFALGRVTSGSNRIEVQAFAYCWSLDDAPFDNDDNHCLLLFGLKLLPAAVAVVESYTLLCAGVASLFRFRI